MNSNGLELLQTLDEHAGSVTCVLFAKQGSQLLSCSADRTVVVREALHRDDEGTAVFAIIRTITLKNSPTSMRLSLYEDAVLLSTTDRCVQVINTQSGRVLSSFKASDGDGGDAVIMSSLVQLPSSTASPIIAGVSSSDKSVRLYSEDGALLARDWGHTEGVTDIAVIRSSEKSDDTSAKIVTVAADGTIFVWDTVPGRPNSSGSDQGLQVPSGISTGPTPTEQPLRKVISHSELVRFQREQSVDMPENEPISPSIKSPTRLRHRPSRLNVNVKQTPRLDPSPLATARSNATGPQPAKSRHRSPSPPSPLRTKASSHIKGRPSTSGSTSASHRERSNSAAASKTDSGGFGSVAASTEQLCRTLKAYRQRLEKSSVGVAPERLVELDNELEMTARLIQRTLGKKRDDLVELTKGMDRWTGINAMGEPQLQDEDDEATPRKRAVHAREESLELPDCGRPSPSPSSLEMSFVSADSYQGSEGMVAPGEVDASGGAQIPVS